jgi:endo-1,4-beta-mannosidase
MTDLRFSDAEPGDSQIASLPWLGVNFWSRTGGPRMWSRYDGDVVREELAVLADHGLTVTRSFCFWPDFVPEPERLDEDVLERFGDFLDAHVELGMQTIPTFIVGHMSGENWDPAWREGRDLYRDVWLVSQQAWFAGEIARRFGRHLAVVAWLVSNEMPLYGGPGTSDEITAWARLVVQAVRGAGATQPISLGDGAWGVETSGNDNGYSLRALAPLVDFFGPHSYPMQDDLARLSLTPAFACELAGSFGKPVILEEFGVSSDFASEENAAAHYRQVLYTTLLAGARGWLAWNNCDYDDLRDQDPYRHHTFELHFGLTDRKGQPKEQLRTMASFGEFVRELAVDGWEPVKGDAALVVPEHFERVLPFTNPAYRQDIRDVLLQAYVASREADLPIELVRERDGIPDSALLYLAPCSKLLTAPGIDRLGALAQGGATVYLSYFAGSTANQRGPWLTSLDEIFGVRHRLRHGLVDPIVDDEVELEFIEDFGDLPAGTRFSFRVAGEPSARAYLPVDLAGAEVMAVDGYGRPCLLRNTVGAGQAVLCTYPLEYMAARTPWANPESTWRIYSALAAVAGVRRPLRVYDPRVLVGRIASGGSETVVLVNCSDDRVTLRPTSGDGEQPTAYPLTLEPFGVATLPLTELVFPGSASSGGTALLSVLTEGGMPSSEPQSTR